MSAVLTAVVAEAPAYTESLKVAIYAATGGRKTLQIGRLIEKFGAENVGIISCEHGLGTIASLVNPDYVREVGNMDELRKTWEWIAGNKDKGTVGAFTRADQWICIDGGSRVLNWVSEEYWSGVNAAYEQILQGKSVKDLPDHLKKYGVFITTRDGINSQQIWIRIAMECTRLFNGYVRLPCSMYWTFWEELTNLDQYSKGPPWVPDTPGKGSRDALKGAFDFVLRLVREGNSSTALCDDGQQNKYYAKRRDDRSAGIEVPNEIKDFNLASFVTKLRGEGFK